MAEVERHDEVVVWMLGLPDSEWDRVVVVVDRLAAWRARCGIRKGRHVGNHSRWDDLKRRRGEPAPEVRAGIEQDLALGQLIYDLRTEAGLSQRALAARMGTTQSVISRLEEGGGAKNRLDTLARVAIALDRHLIVSFPKQAPTDLTDAVQVA